MQINIYLRDVKDILAYFDRVSFKAFAQDKYGLNFDYGNVYTYIPISCSTGGHLFSSRISSIDDVCRLIKTNLFLVVKEENLSTIYENIKITDVKYEQNYEVNSLTLNSLELEFKYREIKKTNSEEEYFRLLRLKNILSK